MLLSLLLSLWAYSIMIKGVWLSRRVLRVVWTHCQLDSMWFDITRTVKCNLSPLQTTEGMDAFCPHCRWIRISSQVDGRSKPSRFFVTDENCFRVKVPIHYQALGQTGSLVFLCLCFLSVRLSVCLSFSFSSWGDGLSRLPLSLFFVCPSVCLSAFRPEVIGSVVFLCLFFVCPSVCLSLFLLLFVLRWQTGSLVFLCLCFLSACLPVCLSLSSTAVGSCGRRN